MQRRGIYAKSTMLSSILAVKRLLQATIGPRSELVRHSTSAVKPRYDFKHIRERAEYIENNIRLRNTNGDVQSVVKLYQEQLSIQHRVDQIRKERNTLAQGQSGAGDRQAAGRRIKEELVALEQQLEGIKAELELKAATLPCDTHPDAPIGPEENARLVALHGSKPVFDGFTPRSHVELGEALGLFDFQAGAAVAGSGFTLLKGDGVLLELALVQWAMSHLVAAGFTPIAPPDVAHSWLVEGCGFNPRPNPSLPSSSGEAAAGGGAAAPPPPPLSSSQVYTLRGSDLCLIGTSEIPLAGLHAGSIVDPGTLPSRYAAVSHCFRREAGAGGVRDRGLYRLHQFTKVEMFAYVAPDAGGTADSSSSSSGVGVGGAAPCPASESMLSALVELQVRMLGELGLHFRLLDMPTQELGAAAYRKYDIEAWMPGRPPAPGSAPSTGDEPLGSFGEVSSASNCIDYQARRLNIRFKAGPKDNRFVHTLNATACAVPRTIIALLETHQQRDGTVVLPPALRPFMGGREALVPKRPLS